MYWCFLGKIEYGRAMEWQQAVKNIILQKKFSGVLLFCEHPPVITMGRSAKPEHLLISDQARIKSGVSLYNVGRGGDVTYHGHGQIVGYPVRHVGRGVKDHVIGMAEAMRTILQESGIKSWWRDDHPGVWTEQGKIGAIGVDARDGVATHGFALNVNPDLSHFEMIVPCGLKAPVTSMQQILSPEKLPSLENIAQKIAAFLSEWYKTPCVELSLSELHSRVS